eukprot:1190838-Prorocentrum_minimum.AAC.5
MEVAERHTSTSAKSEQDLVVATGKNSAAGRGERPSPWHTSPRALFTYSTYGERSSCTGRTVKRPRKLQPASGILRASSNNVYVMTVTKCNANAALAFKFMVQREGNQAVCFVQETIKRALHDMSKISSVVERLKIPCQRSAKSLTYSDITQLLKSYFNKFDEESIRNNFVLIYELLDGASSANEKSCFTRQYLIVDSLKL